MMTPQEKVTHDLIVKTLGEEGHATYAKYFNLFDLHLLDDEQMHGGIAYMIPDRGAIYLNKDIKDLDAVTLLMRHEMLHQYLKHSKRETDYARKKLGLPDDQKVADKDLLKSHSLANVAADWELSKFYAPESDFYKAKAIKKGDKFLQGLVLELDKPEWLNLSFEEILAELEKEKKNLEDKLNTSSSANKGNENSEQRDEISDILDKITKLAKELGQNIGDLKKEKEEISGADNSDESSGQTSDGNQNGGTSDSGKDNNLSKTNKKSSGDAAKDAAASALMDELLQKLKDATKDTDLLNKAAKKLLKDFDERNAEFVPPEEQEGGTGGGGTLNNDYEGRQARLEEIKKFFDDVQQQKEFLDETEARVLKDLQAQERRKKAQGDRLAKQSLKASIGQLRTIDQFKIDLDKAIKSQIAGRVDTVDTYTKPSRRAFGVGMLRPGKTQLLPKRYVPTFAVYYDVSGSFNDPKKYQAAADTINTIQKKYEDKGLIKVNLFYHESGATIYNDRSEKNKVGDNLVQHIAETRPDNIIIITDMDPESTCAVPYDAKIKGYSMMIFPENQTSPTLAGHIHGKHNTYYKLNY